MVACPFRPKPVGQSADVDPAARGSLMRRYKYIWLIGLTVTLLLIAAPLALFLPHQAAPVDDPRAGVPVRPPRTDHAALLPGPYQTGGQVTARCLECHEEAAAEVMATAHWT